MKKILYWSKESSGTNKSKGLLKEETKTKFIVLSGNFHIELHFPKKLYTYEVVEDKWKKYCWSMD
jgi:hypothetical protein